MTMAHKEQTGKKLNKKGFVSYLARRNGTSFEAALRAYDMVVDGIISAAKEGMNLSLMGFGRFYLQEHSGHPVQFKDTDSNTTHTVYMPKYKVFKFSASKALNSEIRRFYPEDSGTVTAADTKEDDT